MKITLIHIVLFAAICIGILIHLHLKEGFESPSDEFQYTKDHCGMIVTQVNNMKQRIEEDKRSNIPTARDDEMLAIFTEKMRQIGCNGDEVSGDAPILFMNPGISSAAVEAATETIMKSLPL